ncbi:type II secretion system F family protein [Candidatus Uhrbacteria bacterium]|nr:type II secretion system F family protein [Candidatus Uhrbacteria bacterium]
MNTNYFLEQLSMLASSGMTVSHALGAIEGEMKSRSMRAFVAGISQDIESGEPLWKAFEKTKSFGEHVISLVRIGEESGTLSQNIRVIALQQEKERMFRSKIRSAFLYPVFVLVLMVVVGVGIAWFILPKLALVFSQLHLILPPVTRVAIAVGLFLQNYGAVAVPAGVLAAFGLWYILFYFPQTKNIGHTLLFVLPGPRSIIRQEEIARFSYMLGTLLQAGMPVVACLQSIEGATVFTPYARLYANMKKHIEEGDSFQKSFSREHHLASLVPMSVQQMIVAAEQSGQLSQVLLHISGYYEEKLDTATKNLAVILEPILLVVVWLGVVAVALSVILPIYQLVGQLNQ